MKTQIFCREMIKTPFDRQYAISMKNELKAPDFVRLYQNNDYENTLYSTEPQTYKYLKNPPSFQEIKSIYAVKEKKIMEEENKRRRKTNEMNLYQDSQLLYMNYSFNKSQMNSENKEKEETNL